MKWSVRVICLLLVMSNAGCISVRKQRKKQEQADTTASFAKAADKLSPVLFDDKEFPSLSGDNQLKNTKVRHKQQKSLAMTSIKQQEAKLADIPIPFYTTPVVKTQEHVGDDIVLHYESRMSADEIKQFYCQQMERHGWQQVTTFSGTELLLNFKKPGRVCAVSIRPKKKIADLVIFVTRVS